MSSFRYLGLSLLFFFLLGGKAFAARPFCYFAYDASVSVTIPTVSTSPLDPVGSILSTITTPGADKYYGWCQYGAQLSNEMLYSSQMTSISHVYATDVPGIGIRFTDLQYGTTFDIPATVYNAAITLGAENTDYSWQGGIIEIVKTGRVTAGVLPAQTLGRIHLIAAEYGNWNNPSPEGIALTVTLASPVIINVGSCVVSTPTALNVPLGDYHSTDFGAVGSTLGSANIDMTLNCYGGVKVTAMISANEDASQAGVIKLTEGSDSATGLGIQILDTNNDPLPIGTEIAMGTTTVDGDYNINWSARYIKTLSKVTAGKANALATVNLNYE